MLQALTTNTLQATAYTLAIRCLPSFNTETVSSLAKSSLQATISDWEPTIATGILTGATISLITKKQLSVKHGLLLGAATYLGKEALASTGIDSTSSAMLSIIAVLTAQFAYSKLFSSKDSTPIPSQIAHSNNADSKPTTEEKADAAGAFDTKDEAPVVLRRRQHQTPPDSTSETRGLLHIIPDDGKDDPSGAPLLNEGDASDGSIDLNQGDNGSVIYKSDSDEEVPLNESDASDSSIHLPQTTNNNSTVYQSDSDGEIPLNESDASDGSIRLPRATNSNSTVYQSDSDGEIPLHKGYTSDDSTERQPVISRSKGKKRARAPRRSHIPAPIYRSPGLTDALPDTRFASPSTVKAAELKAQGDREMLQGMITRLDKRLGALQLEKDQESQQHAEQIQHLHQQIQTLSRQVERLSNHLYTTARRKLDLDSETTPLTRENWDTPSSSDKELSIESASASPLSATGTPKRKNKPTTATAAEPPTPARSDVGYTARPVEGLASATARRKSDENILYTS